MKAFHPAPLPFPLLHIDTTWKFRDMIAFRDAFCRENDLELIVHTNQDGRARTASTRSITAARSTRRDEDAGAAAGARRKYGFDAAFGGARRDEEKSRAKERIYSFRDRFQQWDPKNQRPELWNLYNGKVNKGESIRVFPLSNWTELDVWQYIYLENIPIVPLYFAEERPVVERDGTLIMVDDERMRLQPGETPQQTHGALPHARLLPAVGRDRVRRRRRCPRSSSEMLLTRELRAAGPADRPRRGRRRWSRRSARGTSDGCDDARRSIAARHRRATSRATSRRSCCAS